MTRQVDFDQICAEIAPDDPIEVTAGDKTFHVHPEFPWLAAVAWDQGRVYDAVETLVPKDEVDDFIQVLFAGKASKDRALNRLRRVWNVEAGESKASSRSSKNGSTRSRPTSKRTTG